MNESVSTSRMPELAFGLCALALLLSLVGAWLASSNRSLQTQLLEGQAQVAKSQALVNLDNSLVQMMAKVAVDNNDGDIRRLLAANGVTVKANTPSAPAPKSAGGDDEAQ